MMQAAEMSDGAYRAPSTLDVTRLRRVSFKRPVTPRRVVVRGVLAPDTAQALFAEGNDAVCALTPMLPTTRSTNGLCHGDCFARTTSRGPIAATRCRKTSPYVPSRSRCR